jgi:hypothetical protein
MLSAECDGFAFGGGRVQLDRPASRGVGWEAGMAGMLICDVPDDVIAALEAHARRLGLSRSEYVRRVRLAVTNLLSGTADVSFATS